MFLKYIQVVGDSLEVFVDALFVEALSEFVIVDNVQTTGLLVLSGEQSTGELHRRETTQDR